MAFVEDNATISSIQYFDNHVWNFVQTEGSRPCEPQFHKIDKINKCFKSTNQQQNIEINWINMASIKGIPIFFLNENIYDRDSIPLAQ